MRILSEDASLGPDAVTAFKMPVKFGGMKQSASMFFDIMAEAEQDDNNVQLKLEQAACANGLSQYCPIKLPKAADEAACQVAPCDVRVAVPAAVLPPPSPPPFNAKAVLQDLLGDLYIDTSRLTVLSMLGEGAFAVVERCNMTQANGSGPNMVVAVKKLRPEVLLQARDMREFMTEANLLRKMRHPNIVSIKGIGASELSCAGDVRRSMYLVMEAMDGGTLKSVVVRQMVAQTRYYSMSDALRWCIQIAKAMEYLHHVCKPMIIHRDLKLDNVLLTSGSISNSTAKLADFGLHKRARINKANDILESMRSVVAQNAEKSYYGGNLYANQYGNSSRGGNLYQAAQDPSVSNRPSPGPLSATVSKEVSAPSLPNVVASPEPSNHLSNAASPRPGSGAAIVSAPRTEPAATTSGRPAPDLLKMRLAHLNTPAGGNSATGAGSGNSSPDHRHSKHRPSAAHPGVVPAGFIAARASPVLVPSDLLVSVSPGAGDSGTASPTQLLDSEESVHRQAAALAALGCAPTPAAVAAAMVAAASIKSALEPAFSSNEGRVVGVSPQVEGASSINLTAAEENAVSLLMPAADVIAAEPNVSVIILKSGKGMSKHGSSSALAALADSSSSMPGGSCQDRSASGGTGGTSVSALDPALAADRDMVSAATLEAMLGHLTMSERNANANVASLMAPIPEDRQGQVAPELVDQEAERLSSRGEKILRKKSSGLEPRTMPSGPLRPVCNAQLLDATQQVGSLMYMAPEVLSGNGQYNEKVDVFSFAVMMYELFVGKLLATKIGLMTANADTVNNYVTSRAMGEREAFPKRWPEPLCALVSSCWAQHASKRPGFPAIVAELERMQREGTLAAMDAGLGSSCNCCVM